MDGWSIVRDSSSPEATPWALYAVAIEKTDGRGNVEAKIFHIHATDANEALVHYQVVYPNRRTHRIVGAAPCIGYFVENREGTIVSAS